jgi:hypothetical protein
MKIRIQQNQTGSLEFLTIWANQSLTAEEMNKVVGGEGDVEIVDKPIYIKE